MAARDPVLLVCHGSRAEAGNEDFRAFVRRYAAAAGDSRVEGAFLEIAEPSLDEGLARAAEGASRVVVVPVFLFPARHARDDVPGRIAAAAAQRPGVRYVCAAPLGPDPLLLDVLADRFAEAARSLPAGAPPALLLVGAGTSDPEAIALSGRLAEEVRARMGAPAAGLAFAGVTPPDPATALRALADAGRDRIVVLPFLLFRGLYARLIDEAAALVRAERPGLSIAVAKHLGDDERVLALARARAEAAR